MLNEKSRGLEYERALKAEFSINVDPVNSDYNSIIGLSGGVIFEENT